MSSYSLALAHYRLQFPDEGSLGAVVNGSPSTWKTEYDRVAGVTLDPVLLTSGSFEGGQGSGIKNFDQTVLLRALHARRAELDTSYVAHDPSRPMGIICVFGYGNRFG